MVQARARRVLLLAPDRPHLEELPARLADGADPVVARVTRRMGEALCALAHERFDAAVCWLRSPGDVARVVRFKGAAPRTPVLAFASGERSELASLSLHLGASAVLPGGGDPERTSEALRRAFDGPELAPADEDPRPSGELAARCHALLSEAVECVSRNWAEGFEPLLVEDDSNDALFFVRALRKCGLRRRVPVVQTADEAIAYLSGRGHPAPTLVVLDYHLGNETGEKVLRWIRGEPATARLPVVLFSSCADPDLIARMKGLGVNARVEKPLFAKDLEQTVRLILDFWQIWRLTGGEVG